LSAAVEVRAPGVLEIKAQALGGRQVVFGHFVEARQVFGDPVLEPETAPEVAVGAVDQVQAAPDRRSAGCATSNRYG
jgi:hypothetical protein